MAKENTIRGIGFQPVDTTDNTGWRPMPLNHGWTPINTDRAHETSVFIRGLDSQFIAQSITRSLALFRSDEFLLFFGGVGAFFVVPNGVTVVTDDILG